MIPSSNENNNQGVHEDHYDDHLAQFTTATTTKTFVGAHSKMMMAEVQKNDSIDQFHFPSSSSSSTPPSPSAVYAHQRPMTLRYNWSPMETFSDDHHYHHQQQQLHYQNIDHHQDYFDYADAIVDGHFGPCFPFPYSVPNSFWLVAPSFVNDMKLETSDENQSDHSAYVVIERTGAGEKTSWQMDIQYILIEPGAMLKKENHLNAAMPSLIPENPVSTTTNTKLTFGQWLEDVFARLGFFTRSRLLRQQQLQQRQQLQKQWNISLESLQEMTFLDSGAQGIVFLATYQGKRVAVKKLRTLCNPDDFDHLRKLDHPNLVAFKGVATEATNESSSFDSSSQNEDSDHSTLTSCYLVMEYCPFGQLCQHLSTVEALSPAILADWSRQLASGMEYLHSKGIIHRDLKSPNVLITHGQLLKVCDFDTSHQLHNNRSTSNFKSGDNQNGDVFSRQMSLAGTVAWMAPEMIRNERCSEKIDIWSFGVLLWELITLDQPYRNYETIAILFGVGNGTLRLPMPDFTEETTCLCDLLTSCLETDPSRRPSFTEILEQFLVPIAQKLTTFDELNFMRLQSAWKLQVSTMQRIRLKSVTSSSSSSSYSSSSSSESFGTQKITGGKCNIDGDISYLGVKRRKILISAKKRNNRETKENLPPQMKQFKTAKISFARNDGKRKFATVKLDENRNELIEKNITGITSSGSTFSSSSLNFKATPLELISSQQTSNACNNHHHRAKRMKRSSSPSNGPNNRKTGNAKHIKPGHKTSPSAFPFSVNVSENQQAHHFPTPTAAVDANLLKYLYYLIRRTCK